MFNQPLDLLDSPDWDVLSESGIELSEAQIDRALQLCQSIADPHQQWQIYLHALALLGFEQWLAEWAPDLQVVDTHCSILHPQYANLIDSVCQLQVGRFTIGLIAAGQLTDRTIAVPRAIVDLPTFSPHFYVLVEVLEEEIQISISGYLRRDRLQTLHQASPLTASGWMYELPRSWFEADATDLLLELRCLDPAVIAAVPIATPALVSVPQLQARLEALRLQLRTPGAVHQLLTWTEAATLLTQPQLMDWLAALGSGTAASQNPTEPDLTLSLNPPSRATPINVANWLRDRLDAVAQELSWRLLPAFSTAAALRSQAEELRDIQIPPGARCAYQVVQVGQFSVRLYAVTWVLSQFDRDEGWTLMVVLKAAPNEQLPIGMRLVVQDATQVLGEQVINQASPESLAYIQVGGDWNEQFWVTITAPTGTTSTLPPFTFAEV